jgi:hypothetical protein
MGIILLLNMTIEGLTEGTYMYEHQGNRIRVDGHRNDMLCMCWLDAGPVIIV